MNKSRRNKMKLLVGVAGTSVALKWHKPIISSVILPAHAQTSACLVADIVGNWGFVFDDFIDIDEILGSINTDGTANLPRGDGNWTLSSNELVITFPNQPNRSLFATIDSSCSSMRGIHNLNSFGVFEDFNAFRA